MTKRRVFKTVFQRGRSSEDNPHFTFHASRFLGMTREQNLGNGASLGKEAVLAASGRVGEVDAGVGRVRRQTFSTSG
jgi:hypothetical protein